MQLLKTAHELGEFSLAFILLVALHLINHGIFNSFTSFVLLCSFFGLQYHNYNKHHPFPMLRPFAKKLFLILSAFIGLTLSITARLIHTGKPIYFIAVRGPLMGLCTVSAFIIAVLFNTHSAYLQQSAPTAYKTSILLLATLLLLTSFCIACNVTLIPNIAKVLVLSRIGFIESLRIQLMTLSRILPCIDASVFFISFSAKMRFFESSTYYNRSRQHLQAIFSKIIILSAIPVIGHALPNLAWAAYPWRGQLADIVAECFYITLRFFSFSFSLPYIERELFPLTFPAQSQAAFAAPPHNHNPNHSPSTLTFSVQSQEAFAAPQPPDAPDYASPLSDYRLFQDSKTQPSSTIHSSTC